jgi:hypothetical protein
MVYQQETSFASNAAVLSALVLSVVLPTLVSSAQIKLKHESITPLLWLIQ